jgi:hypothetical protein
MAYSKSQRKATEKWEAQNYEQIKFTVPKGFKARLKESAERTGKSQRAFIIESLEKEMGGTKLYWVNFIIDDERPYFLSHSHPYRTLEKANDSIKKTLESFNVILSYIQEQDTETGKLMPIVVTPHINSMGTKI